MAPINDPVNQSTSGGDFMADVLNSLGIRYLAINCASSFRGLHEAVLNHARNKPEIMSLYGAVPMALNGVETGRWLSVRAAGVVLNDRPRTDRTSPARSAASGSRYPSQRSMTGVFGPS
jgi:hypothetical protein